MEVALKELEGWVEEREVGRRVLVGGDFNARTGGEGGGCEREGGLRRRRSRDEVINAQGKKLVEFVEEMGWGIFNGCMRGDEQGEFTFTEGKGNTVIDYVMRDIEAKEGVERMEIGDRIDSDHMPLVVEIVGGGGWKNERRKTRKREWRRVWDEEGKREFQQRMGGIELREGGIEEQWREMEERIAVALKEVEECRRGGRKGKTGWWDEEYREGKREVRKRLRKWRRGRGEEGEYKRGKREYRELCERKKKEENERWERRVKEASRESDVWEIVNRERRGRRRVNEEIGMGEWKEHFMQLLGRVEDRAVKGEGRREEGRGRRRR